MSIVKFDDKWCSYQEIKDSENWNGWFCPFCNEPFKKGDETFFLMNNRKLFPNILCHKECVSNKIDEQTVRDLENMYNFAVRHGRAWLQRG